MAKTRAARRETRTEKVEKSFSPAQPLQPKNQTQMRYMQAIYNSPIVIATGYAGTGKTYVPGRIAGRMFNNNQVERIVLSRPPVSSSDSLGFFKGTKNEKMLGWLAPILGALKEEFSPANLEYLMKDDVDKITCCPLETIKGSSWKNSFIIFDEAEDLTIKELWSILTRIGNGSTMVLCGDISQTDLARSGLSILLQLMEIEPKLKSVISHVHFGNVEDIVRGPACREIVIAFERSVTAAIRMAA